MTLMDAAAATGLSVGAEAFVAYSWRPRMGGGSRQPTRTG